MTQWNEDMIDVIIVEDEGLFRDMLKIALSSFPNLRVVGAVGSGNEAIHMVKEIQPNVVLMDIELGSEPNGIEAGRMIRNEFPQI